MIIPPKAIFCLNAKTTLNKSKETKKKSSLTKLELEGIEEGKRQRGKKIQHFNSWSETVSIKFVFLCELIKKSIKGNNFF